MAHAGDVGRLQVFNLSERYERWRDYRVDPRGRGLHGLGQRPRLATWLMRVRPASGTLAA